MGDVADMKLVRRYQAHSAMVNRVAAHNSEPHMFTSCSNDGSVLVWDTRNVKPAKRIRKLHASVANIRYTTYHTLLYNLSGSCMRVSFRSSSVRSHLVLECGGDRDAGVTTAVAYCGDKLASGTERGQIWIRDMRTAGDVPLKSVSGAHKRAIRRLRYCPNRCTVNVNNTNTNTNTNKTKSSLFSSNDLVCNIIFSMY